MPYQYQVTGGAIARARSRRTIESARKLAQQQLSRALTAKGSTLIEERPNSTTYAWGVVRRGHVVSSVVARRVKMPRAVQLVE
jgi:hypothetical protein